VSCEALYEMRLAGFISGTGLYSVKTPFGGWADLGRGSDFYANFGTAPALGFHVTGSSGLSTKAASAIDTSFDDGNPTSGSWRCNGVAAYALATPDAVIAGICSMQL
jgi:hypothetical protein